MQCTNCGAQLPDGSRFCTECGTRLPLDSGDLLTFDPDRPAPRRKETPDLVFDPPRPKRGEEPEPVSEPAPEENAGRHLSPEAEPTEGPAPAADALPDLPSETEAKPADSADDDWKNWTPEAVDEELRPADGSHRRHSHHGDGSHHGSSHGTGTHFAAADFTRREDYDAEGPTQPVYKRWWFWVLITLAALFMIAAMVYAALNADRSRQDIPDPTPEPVAETAEPEDTPEPEPTEEPVPALSELWDLTGFDAAGAESAADVTDALDAFLTERDISHDIAALEDGQIDIRLWREGTHRRAEEAVDGDAQALSEWQSLISELTDLQAQVQAACAGTDAPETVVCLYLLSDQFSDMTLTIAADDALVYDAVTGVDRLAELETPAAPEAAEQPESEG